MLAVYFCLAFAVTWTLDLPALLAARGLIAGPPQRFMNLVGLGAFGPMIAAMIAARLDGTGMGRLLRPLRPWRVGVRWYLVAILAPGATFVASALAYNLTGHAEPLLYLPDNPSYLAAAIVFPLGEEIGWRGYALPRLLDRVGAVRGSVILGVLWTLWHIPMLTLQGVPPWMYGVFVPYMVGGSVLFTWIYGHTRGSLLLAVLTHVGTHLNNPGHAMPGRSLPMVLHAAGYVVLAIVLLVADRRAWQGEPGWPRVLSYRSAPGIASADEPEGAHTDPT